MKNCFLTAKNTKKENTLARRNARYTVNIKPQVMLGTPPPPVPSGQEVDGVWSQTFILYLWYPLGQAGYDVRRERKILLVLFVVSEKKVQNRHRDIGPDWQRRKKR